MNFAHFGLESGMVFEGDTGVYERIVSIPHVACSAGVFWVGETLFVFVIVVAAIFDFMTIGE